MKGGSTIIKVIIGTSIYSAAWAQGRPLSWRQRQRQKQRNKESSQNSNSGTKPPNLIVILTDDQGYHDVGFNGCKDIPTPHLDSIAKNGVRFTQGYVSHPVCGPSRAGLLTGRYQDRFGFTGNPTLDPNNPDAGIPLSEENMAEILRKANYSSACIGKYHMGSHINHHPLNRGFDYFYGFLTGGHRYFPEELVLEDLNDVRRDHDWYRTKILENHERIDIGGYLTDELTNAAEAFIDRHVERSKNSPFFLYLAYNAPHTPLQATEEYLKRFSHIQDPERRTYAAMLSAVDDGVGSILDKLRGHEMEEDTLIVFLSDNGGSTKNKARNTPLKGFKGDVWEGGLHVPFAMQWKGKLPAGHNFTSPVISFDILATIAELARIEISADRPLDGVNLVPYVTGEKHGPPHNELFWRHWKKRTMAVRVGDLKLVRNNANHLNYKLNWSFRLYNLTADPSERRNIRKDSDVLQATSNALKQQWNDWNAQLKDPAFPDGNDAWWEREKYTTESPTVSPTAGPTVAPTVSPQG